MANLERVKKHQVNIEHQDVHLKGTFVSVMILGGIIIGCWLFVFFLFISRNGG